MRITIRGCWVVATAMGLLGYIVWGIGFYTMPLFYVPLEAEFGWSRTALTFMGALTILGYSLSGPVVGALADSLGVRRLMIAGVMLFGVSLTLFATSPGTIGIFYLVACLNGIACGFVSLLPSQILVSRWFERNRAGAMGFILALMALGGIVNTSLAGNLIVRLGWRPTVFIFDLLVWGVALPICLFLIRDRPEGELEPDVRAAAPDHRDGVTLAEAVRSPQFYVLCGAVFFNMAVGNALLQNIVLYVHDLGHGLRFGAYVMSFVVIANLIGRLVVGVLCDSASVKFGAFLSSTCLGIAVLAFLGSSGRTPLLIAGLVTGFGYGGSILVLPVMTGAIFGTRSLGKILGLVLLSLGIGSASGTFLVGRVFDATKSYSTAFLPLILFGLISLILILQLRLRPLTRTAASLPPKRRLFRFAFGRRE